MAVVESVASHHSPQKKLLKSPSREDVKGAVILEEKKDWHQWKWAWTARGNTNDVALNESEEEEKPIEEKPMSQLVTPAERHALVSSGCKSMERRFIQFNIDSESGKDDVGSLESYVVPDFESSSSEEIDELD